MKHRVSALIILTIFTFTAAKSAFSESAGSISPFLTNPLFVTPGDITTQANQGQGLQTGPGLSTLSIESLDLKGKEPATNEPASGYGYDRQIIKEAPLSVFEKYVQGLSSGILYVSTQIKQFGYDLFEKPPSTFAPVTNVPVGPDYILGPGDELRISYWGSINGEFSPVLDSEGKITLPYFGSLYLSGLTFSQAKEYLEKEFRRQYKPGQVKLNITTGRLRTIGVFVVGKAKSPGRYTLSSLSTLATALFASGGPGKNGSMRDIQVRRNGEVITTFDMYDFLLRGDKTSDVRLMPEDVIFIPPVGHLVGIAGNVKIPAIYELKDEDSLAELIELAGGLNDIAFTGRVQIIRIEENSKQVILESDLDREISRETAVQPGDVVKIFPIVIDNRVVRLSGAVQREGEYGFSEGMTVKDLISFAGGLKYYAYMEEAELIRITPTPKGPITKKIMISPEKAVEGDPEHNLELQADDALQIKSVPEWQLYNEVVVTGEVRFPGVYSIEKGERLSSLIERVGLLETSYMKGGVFTRLSVRELQQTQLDESIDRLERQILAHAATATQTAISVESIVSEKAAAEQRILLVAKLRSARAKGRLALNLSLARNIEEFKGSPHDLVLEDGDSLHIPERSAQIQVLGAVYNQNAFVYTKKGSVDRYINLAGGFTKDADKKEVYILKVDGTAISDRGTSGFKRLVLDPGDTIVVPEKLDKIAWMRYFKDVTQILYQLAITAAVLITL